MYEKQLDNGGNTTLVGTALTSKGKPYPDTLSPTEEEASTSSKRSA